MRKVSLLLIFIGICGVAFGQASYSTKITHYAGTVHEFHFFRLKDTLKITVRKFIKNDLYCFTEAVPYALIIGAVNNDKNYPPIISVLAICDNNVYKIGDKLNIVQNDSPLIGSSLHPVDFIRDTIIDKKRFLCIEGGEYPALWATILH
jgi:hypothetical protein